MTRFSIVTINWNNLAGLKLTYDSLKAQTYRDFRWIVVDGASSDGAVEWLASLDDAQAEITSEKDRGIYDAMNKGLKQAVQTPGYTLFLNSGDCLADPEVLQRIAEAVEQAPVRPRFIYGDYYRKSPEGELTWRAAKGVDWLVRGLPSSHQSMYFENELASRVRFRENFRLSADYCMLVEFLQQVDASREVLKLPLPLCIFDTTGVSQKRRFDALKEDLQIRMQHMKLSAANAWFLYLLHYLHTHTKILRASLGR